MTTSKPLLCLTMIVRDEAPSIRAIAESVLGHVDCYAIVDTGSTDGTPEIAVEVLKGLPGKIASRPFVDFATARNESLALAEEVGASYAIVLSGDETFVDPDGNLRRFCEAHVSEETAASYNVQVEFNRHRFDSTRLVRLNAGWRYRGLVHEVVLRDGSPPPRSRVPGCHVLHDHASALDQDRRRLRLYRDLEQLREEIIRSPNDARLHFYLAQTFMDLGFMHQAYEEYSFRVGLGGWKEEQYEAAFRMAKAAMFVGKQASEIQQLYLNAYSFDPKRAEPLYEIANMYYFRKEWQLCWLFASLAARLPYPEDCHMFVNVDVYEYRAAHLAGVAGFHVGEYEAGERFARMAAEARPGDARVVEALKCYTNGELGTKP